MGASDAQTEKSGSGCPVRHDGGSMSDGSGSSFMSWLSLSGKPGSDKDERGQEQTRGAKPPTYASIEEAAKHAQTPQPDQRIHLGTQRTVSSIPRDGKGEVKSPHHQHGDSESHWVYPSEQQMYNAMRRKGWDNVPEDSIPLVLQIHNAVNEGTWEKIMKWEGTDQLRLVRFEGRPRDLTPLAFFYSKILHLYPAPFDRHDWYVGSALPDGGKEGGTNTVNPPQRYVIDYYMFDQPDPSLPPLTHIDVRPALDGTRGFYLRGQNFLCQAFPGITNYLKRLQGEKAMDQRLRQQQYRLANEMSADVPKSK
mmetsp:Transcript_35517/g.73952  ORF Transcript_35517/g.73952 Transcript_35517/m.73952 type:complete len:309 (-) Transcript_35517:1294-2220(-)